MKIAIIQFPGSNCETESLRAIRMAGMEAEEFLWNRNPRDLASFDGYFIVGGFSYEDRSRSGVIASLDPLMPHLKTEAEKGKPVLGVCNGAQILVETGLVPGLKDDALGMALAVNKRVQNGKVIGTGFYNTWVNIKMDVPNDASAFTRNMKTGEIMRVPIAHGEGRFIIPEELLTEMIKNNQTTFRYCDDAGIAINEFPTNPNGAIYNLAAVTNPSGTIMAMMPHPERTPNGQPIFTSMRDYISEHHAAILNEVNNPLKFVAPSEKITSYLSAEALAKADSFTLPIELMITDNEAVTVENALRSLGFPVHVSRAVHWEITVAPGDNLEQTKTAVAKSGELFNPSKEKIAPNFSYDPNCLCVLVRYRDDFVGQQKKESLQTRFGLQNIVAIKQGILWRITVENGTIEQLRQRILDTHILHNPYSQECFIC